MSGADVLGGVEGHGTTLGYAAGCRSLGGCPGKDGPYGQSCMDARRRQMGEWPYARAVANGREVELLAREVEERTAPPSSSPKVAQAKRAQRKNQGLPAAAAADVEEPVEVAPVEAPAPDLKHGTTWGYARGCRTAEACPKGADGRSCVQAQNEYQREYRARKKAELQEQRAEVPAADPEPVVEVAPDQSDVVMPEELVEEPRPRGTRVLDDALRTIAESVEMQRAVAAVTERSLRTARTEIKNMRRELADVRNGEEKR